MLIVHYLLVSLTAPFDRENLIYHAKVALYKIVQLELKGAPNHFLFTIRNAMMIDVINDAMAFSTDDLAAFTINDKDNYDQ